MIIVFLRWVGVIMITTARRKRKAYHGIVTPAGTHDRLTRTRDPDTPTLRSLDASGCGRRCKKLGELES